MTDAEKMKNERKCYFGNIHQFMKKTKKMRERMEERMKSDKRIK